MTEDEELTIAQPSPRETAARAAAAAFAELGWGTLTGGGVRCERSPSRRCWEVFWRRQPAGPMGKLEVYSPAWVRVGWVGDIPGFRVSDDGTGSRVYASVEEAVLFLRLALVDGDGAAAARVAEKPPAAPRPAKAPAGPADKPARKLPPGITPEGVPADIGDSFFGGGND
jgi:hypothetical protein